MKGYPLTNLADYFQAKTALSDSGLIGSAPTEINFEIISNSEVVKTYKTFNKQIHSGVYIKHDKSLIEE